MTIKHCLSTALLSLAILSSCTKDSPLPEPLMSVTEDVIAGTVNSKITLSVTGKNSPILYHRWKMNDSIKGDKEIFEFTPAATGTYRIEYIAINTAGNYSKTYTINVTPPIRDVTPTSNMYVTQLFEFLPAPGQFINKAPGNMVSAEGILGKKTGMVSLGAWGGTIVLGFDHTVLNVADKEDIIVYGNPQGNFAEPAIIWVMQDENANGKPDDTWYEVAGSEFGKPGYIRNYEVTYTKPNPTTADVPWRDNQGNTGVVKTNTFHKQSYFPEWAPGNEYTLKGSLLPSSNIDMTVPSYITSMPFAWGYADNRVGGDKIDIANAVDKDGKKMNLKGIDFIKIQTGIQANMGWLGELSTEILGVADASLIK